MNWIEDDKNYVWHPFTQISKAPTPKLITKGKGTLLFDEEGNSYIDAISSWWVNPHGHSNPNIAEAIKKQVDELEHVIFADFTHKPAIKLAKSIIEFVGAPFEKVFFSDNGSTAVEVGLKMAIQFHYNLGKPRKKIISFKEGYHGDTFGAMAMGDKGTFFEPFENFVFEVEQVHAPIPGKEEEVVKAFEKIAQQGNVAAFVFEPLLLGSGGMLMYTPEVLDKLLSIAKEHGIICVADEVMTGFGRTGKPFAINYLENKPDIICLSKCLTGGFLPLSLTLATNKIYQSFVSADHKHTLYHGHSFTANPLGCAAALASLELTNSQATFTAWEQINQGHQKFALKLKALPAIENIRIIGTIIAFEVNNNEAASYFNSFKVDFKNYCFENGVLLRPLGNTVYILPPFCITPDELQKVYTVCLAALEKLA